MPRSIDHLVLAVPDLAAAVARYRAMGFVVGATNRHPWGTVNAIVQLEGASFLELIGLGADFAPPGLDDPAATFALPVAASVTRGGGLAMVALRSEDADADAEAFRASGFGPGRRLDFGRTAEAADGTRRHVRFSLAFAAGLDLGEAAFFTCRHHAADAFRRPEALLHRNGARRLAAVSLTLDDPGRRADALSTLLDVAPSGPPERPSFALAEARLDLMTAAGALARHGVAAQPGRFASFALAVPSLDPVRRCLGDAGVPHRDVDGGLMVPPEWAFGAALAFSPEPCEEAAHGA